MTSTVKTTAPFQYTKEQLEGIDLIQQTCENRHLEEVLIEGPPGTGKTTLIKEGTKGYEIVAAAISHKAKNILKKNLNASSCHTVAKLLGYKVQYKLDGSIVFKEDKKAITPPILDLPLDGVLVIDECSMISPTIKRKILTEASKQNVPVIWVGDIAQLPYIDEYRADNADSPTFDVEPKVSLKRNMRCGEEHSSMKLQRYIRELILTFNETGKPIKYKLEKEDQEGLKFLKSYKEVLSHFLFLYNQDPTNINQVRLIAYRNKTVDQYNNIIRKLIFRDKEVISNFEIGDFLIARENYTYRTKEKDENDNFVSRKHTIHNAEIFKVEKIELQKKSYEYPYKHFNLNGGIKVLHPDEQEAYDKELKRLQKQAIKIAKENRSSGGWITYYQHKEMFANVKYAYCITSHLSQGSTYNNTIALESDIMSVTKITMKEKLQSLYVAVSRHSDKLFIL